MPPQTKFTPEVILAQAFEVVRQEGLDALSARRIAQELNCSTQPVYNTFASMQELQDVVIEKAKEYALAYLSQEADATAPFLSFGLRYFRFAQEEKPLFKLLFLEGQIGISLENLGQPFRSLLAGMKGDPNLQGLSEESLKRIGTNMWVYLHGLTTLTYKSSQETATQLVREQLLQMGRTLIEWERKQFI